MVLSRHTLLRHISDVPTLLSDLSLDFTIPTHSLRSSDLRLCLRLGPLPCTSWLTLGVLAPTWTSSQLPGVYSPISSYPSYPTIILSYLPLIMYFDLRLVCNPASHCSLFVFLSSATMPRVYPFVLTDFDLCSDFGFHLV